ncbi:MAG: pyruvate kinase [Gemmatimonadota bacterium]|nr:pyruvate kinase [Gemmatimonadota bacterium]
MSAGFRRAKIVSTIGPASWEPDVFRDLVEAGMDAVRINFSHSSHEHATTIASMVDDAVRDTGRPIAVIGDLRGPKIRVGDLEAPLAIEPEARYCFFPQGSEPPADMPAERLIPTTYPELGEEVEVGNRILLDDGRFEFVVEEVEGRCVLAQAYSSGELKPQKGINLPGVRVGAPTLTEKDHEDIAFARERQLDYLALSFVRRPEDLRTARQAMDKGCLLIAKIEKSQALASLSEILSESDGVMVARGDLGVELPYEEVPMIQKRIIRLSQERARPVITATQMLESMIESPRPTRAEVSDVANALLDGTDAVMLSAETAVGDYPVEAVRTMDRIIRRIEHERLGRGGRAGRPPRGLAEIQQTTSGAIAAASLQAVERLDSPFIVTFTRSGYTARLVSAQRPSVPILAITDQWRTFNQMALIWGVQPVLFQGDVNYKSMLGRAREIALDLGLGEEGEKFVVTAGVPFHVPGTTNMMRIEEL